MEIRRARPEEAALLSDLALRSKAHWGYDAEFLERCRPSLTLTRRYIDSDPVYVAEDAGEVLGFYGLTGSPPEGELEYLFVDPARIGTGVGRSLIQHAFATARDSGFDSLSVEADPGAEPFYLRAGAEPIGERPSPAQEGRYLPLLRVTLKER